VDKLYVFFIDYGNGLYIAGRLDSMPSCVPIFSKGRAGRLHSQSLDIILGWARASQTKLQNGVVVFGSWICLDAYAWDMELGNGRR
jgi:hypothetical protein